LEKSFTRSWLLRQSLPCFICLAKNYLKHKTKTPMENYQIKTTKVLELKMEVPKYFKIVHLHYMLINEDDVLVVNPFYLSDLLSYAYIKVDQVRWHSDFWAKNELEPISLDEFRQVYTEAFLKLSNLIK